MSRLKTGRTEHLCIKVTKEIRDQMRDMVEQGFNLSQGFEEIWTKAHPLKDTLKIKKEKLLLEMNEVNMHLHDLKVEELFEATLTLSGKETQVMEQCLRHFPIDEEKQMKFFCSMANRKVQSLSHYLAIRNKYYQETKKD